MRKIAKHLEHEDVMLRVNPDVAKELKGNNARLLNEMEELTKRTIIVKSDPALHQGAVRHQLAVSTEGSQQMAFINDKCHCIMEFMTTTLTLDKAGRVVLPEPVRDETPTSAGGFPGTGKLGGSHRASSAQGRCWIAQKTRNLGFSTGEPISAEATE